MDGLGEGAGLGGGVSAPSGGANPGSLSAPNSPLLHRRPVCDSSVLLCLKKRFHLGRIYVWGTHEGVVGWDSLSHGVREPSGHPHPDLGTSVPLHPSPWAGC